MSICAFVNFLIQHISTFNFITIHLYSMEKKAFHSQLFRRIIEVSDPDYWAIVHGETIFRIYDLEVRKCTCFKCIQDLEKYKDFLTRLRSASVLPQNKD